MTKRTQRTSALVSATDLSIERKAKRISRLQKGLAKEVGLVEAKASAVSTRVRPLALKTIEPMTDAQKLFFDLYDDGYEAFLMYGSAGSGKTFLALYNALVDIMEPQSIYKRIIIVRSTVQVREMGFLKGTEEEKLAPFEAPYMEICAELLGRKDAYEKLKDSGKIEFCSSSFLRGISFRDAIIIGDELQNFNWGEISTLITRMGKTSKLILCGDYAQNDLTKNKNDVSGFKNLMDVIELMPDFQRVKFTPDDCVRSGFVKSFIMACEKLGL